MSRLGAYGVLAKDSKILLNWKKSGPYQGLLDLPGGAIEFGETPEDALKRELLEETALLPTELEYLGLNTTVTVHEDYEFHHIGIFYRVTHWTEEAHLTGEEESIWIDLKHFDEKELTPFAKRAIESLPKNKGWRPPNSIRGKVIGIAKEQNRILVVEVLDDEGNLKGWCPIGGGIAFGETAQEALIREVQEELKCDVQIFNAPLVWENIFKHHGVQGHEIIFAFSVRFREPKVYQKKRFQIFESNGESHWAQWIEIDQFKTGKTLLFPPGLINKV